MSRPTASFDGIDFASAVPGLSIVRTDPYRYPNRILNTSVVATGDKSVTPSAYLKDKKLNVGVEIGVNTRELLDASIDALYAFLQGREKALVLSYGTGTRQWYATLANVGISEVQGGHAILDIEFEVSDPAGSDVNSTSLFSTVLTGSSSTTSFIVGGTAPWQKPVVTITLSALTGGTNKAITVGNPANGQTLVITRNWTAGDILVIGSKQEPVTVNSTEVSFAGAIPEWAPGTGSMSYSDDLTTRTRTMTGVYYKRYV